MRALGRKLGRDALRNLAAGAGILGSLRWTSPPRYLKFLKE